MAETASRGRITYIEGRPGADSRRAGPMPRPHWAVSAAAAESGRAVPPRQRTRCVRGDGPLAHPTAAGDPHKSGRPTAIKPSRCPSQTGPTHQALWPSVASPAGGAGGGRPSRPRWAGAPAVLRVPPQGGRPGVPTCPTGGRPGVEPPQRSSHHSIRSRSNIHDFRRFGRKTPHHHHDKRRRHPRQTCPSTTPPGIRK
jgi:hypothetical protein